MSARLRLIAILTVFASLGAGVAVAARLPVVGAPPPKINVYRGSDAVGPVRFTLLTPSSENGSSASPPFVSNFHFANKCAKRGTTVSATFEVRAGHRFSYRAHGITVSGVLHGPGSSQATGTARTRTSACDSGRLSFTARTATAPAFTG